MNNSKLLFSLACLVAVMLTAPVLTAAPRGSGGRGHHFSSMGARPGMGGRPGMGSWSGQRWSGGNWRGGNWSGRNGHGGNWNGGNWAGHNGHGGNWNGGNWGGNNWHHHHGNNVIFIGDFGFPWWWG